MTRTKQHAYLRPSGKGLMGLPAYTKKYSFRVHRGDTIMIPVGEVKNDKIYFRGAKSCLGLSQEGSPRYEGLYLNRTHMSLWYVKGLHKNKWTLMNIEPNDDLERSRVLADALLGFPVKLEGVNVNEMEVDGIVLDDHEADTDIPLHEVELPVAQVAHEVVQPVVPRELLQGAEVLQHSDSDSGESESESESEDVECLQWECSVAKFRFDGLWKLNDA